MAGNNEPYATGSESSVKPIIQHFNRLQGILTDASRLFTLLPQNPALLPLMIGTMQELFRLPRAMSVVSGDKDSDRGFIEEIEKDLLTVRDKAFKENADYINAVKNREDYMFNTELYAEINDVYDKIYVLLGKKGLLVHISIDADIAEALKKRAGE